MFKITAISIAEDDQGLEDRGIEISIARPDGKEFVNRIWLRKELGILPSDVSNDALVAICLSIDEVINTPIPMPEPEPLRIVKPEPKIIIP